MSEKRDDLVREVFVKNCRQIYELDNGKVFVIAFIHGARQCRSSLL